MYKILFKIVILTLISIPKRSDFNRGWLGDTIYTENKISIPKRSDFNLREDNKNFNVVIVFPYRNGLILTRWRPIAKCF